MIKIQEIPKRFCRRTVYMLLSLQPATFDELKSALQSNFHDQLERILLDGLHEGVFGLMYGGCKDGLWSLNKTCSDRRARRFIERNTPAPSFPEKIRRNIFYGNEATESVNVRETDALKRQKTKDVKEPKPYIKFRSIQVTQKRFKNQRKDWNDEIAIDFEKELQRLRQLRFDNGLNGVDRGALK